MSVKHWPCNAPAKSFEAAKQGAAEQEWLQTPLERPKLKKGSQAPSAPAGSAGQEERSAHRSTEGSTRENIPDTRHGHRPARRTRGKKETARLQKRLREEEE